MAILFKSRNKIKRYQVGGTIPFYAKASYTPSFGVKYDPSALLTKYAKEDTEDDKKDKKDKQVKSPYDGLKPAGLDNDNRDITEKIAKNYEDLQYGLENIDDFEKSKAYLDIEKNNIYLSGLLEQNRSHETEWKTNVGLMDASQGGDALVYQNGSFLVREPVVDEEGKMIDYEYAYKPATELFDEKGQLKGQLQPITTKDLAESRRSDKRLIGNYNAIAKIKDGIGMAKGVTEYLDPFLTNLGLTKGGYSKEIGGMILDEKVLSSALDGDDWSSNSEQLNGAMESIKSNLDPKFRNALEAIAWLKPIKDENTESGYRGPKNQKEVDDAVNAFLALQVYKRLATSHTKKSIEKYDLKGTENLNKTGNLSGAVAEISPYTQEASGTGSSRNVTLEIPHSDPKKSSFYTFYGTNAPHFAGDLLSNQTLNENDKFKKLGPVDQSFLSDGTQVNDVIQFGDVGPVKLIDLMMPLRGTDVTIMVVPVLKNDVYNKAGKVYKKKGAVATADWVSRMNKELAKIKKGVAGDKERNEIVQKYDKMLNGTVEMKLVAQYKVTYNQKAANYTMDEGTEEQKSAAKILASAKYGGSGYGKNIDGAKAQMWLTHFAPTLPNTSVHLKGWTDFDAPGDIKSINIMTPIGTFMETSSAGGVNAYTMKYNLNFGSIVNNNAPSTFGATTKNWK